MIALEVRLNGKRICVAGAEDLAVLTAMVTASGPLGRKTVPVRSDEICDIYYRVGGLTGRCDESKDVHLTWRKFEPLGVGDSLQITILETRKADRPRSRHKRRKTKPLRRSPR